MNTVETVYTSPTRRARLEYDNDAECPLSNWGHGAQFITLPSMIGSWRNYTDLEDYSDPYTSVPAIQPDYWNVYREWFEHDYSNENIQPQNAPSFATFLNRNCAAWGTIKHNDTMVLDTNGNLDNADAVILLSRATFRQWHMIDDGKPMPRGYQKAAIDTLYGIVDEYNAWASGDVYGIVTEAHNAACPYCDDLSQPDNDCPCWDTEDSCWGFVGYEYAMDTLRNGDYQ